MAQNVVEKLTANRFLILPDVFTKNDENGDQFVKLRHPQTGNLSFFIYSESKKKLAEMRSLPVNEGLIFSGRPRVPVFDFDIVTTVDPLFILLPYFVKNSSSYSLPDKILMDKEHPEMNDLLMKLSKWTDIQQIASITVTEGQILWKYNKQNTLKWLVPKVEKVSRVLDHRLFSKEDNQKNAYHIVSKYLPVTVQKLLLRCLFFPKKKKSNKRKFNENISNVRRTVNYSEDSQRDETSYDVGEGYGPIVD